MTLAILVLLMISVIWLQFIAFWMKSTGGRVAVIGGSFVLLFSLGALAAHDNLVGGLLRRVEQLSPIVGVTRVLGWRILSLEGLVIGFVFVPVILLLVPLVMSLIILYAGIRLKKRRLGWTTSFIQTGLWAVILVMLFAVCYSSLSGANGVWLVDGHYQPFLHLSQSEFLSFQVFLSFSFGDIVPAMHLVNHHLPEVSRLAAQALQLEAVVSHLYWVGVVASFVALLWNPPPDMSGTTGLSRCIRQSFRSYPRFWRNP